MAKILLIDPPWYIFQHIKSDSVSLGITYIATVLKEQGHECLIYNGDFTKETLNGYEKVLVDYKVYVNELKNKKSKVWADLKYVLKSFRPDYVGISIMTPKYSSAIEAAKIVKKYNPEIPIFVGGLHPTLMPLETLKEPNFDILAIGEGEETVSDLIAALEAGKDLSSVKGIYHKSKSKIIQNPPRPLIVDIDKLPFPDFTLLYRFKEYPPDNLNRILTSRGCPFNCVYCASKQLWTRKVRFRSSEKVFEEIKYRHDKFGVRSFKFNDDTFTLNRQRLEKLCNLIIGDKMKIEWYCDTRADKLTENILNLMKKAGCYQINIGVESGSKKIFDSINKGESLESIKRAFKLTKKVKISTLAYFMMGLPDERKEDVLKSIKLMKEIKPDIVCWSLFTPYPGTDLYDSLVKDGLLPKNPEWSTFFHHSPDMKFSKHISKKEWHELIKYVDDEIQEYLKANMLSNIIHNPIPTVLKRIRIYRKYPYLIRRDIGLIPKISRTLLKRYR